MIAPWEWLFVLLKASVASTTGTGNLPILHDELIARGWAREHDFAEALAMGQITPGPTGLWVISLGYLVDGLRGALFAVVAVSLPPFTALLAHSLLRRFQAHPATQGFINGLNLAVAAIFLVVMARIYVQAGVSWTSAAIALAAIVLSQTKRVPLPLILVLAGLVGVWGNSYGM